MLRQLGPRFGQIGAHMLSQARQTGRDEAPYVLQTRLDRFRPSAPTTPPTIQAFVEGVAPISLFTR